MAFSPRLAALAAVVAVPLGIAATSYAMTDSPEAPKVPPEYSSTARRAIRGAAHRTAEEHRTLGSAHRHTDRPAHRVARRRRRTGSVGRRR